MTYKHLSKYAIELMEADDAIRSYAENSPCTYLREKLPPRSYENVSRAYCVFKDDYEIFWWRADQEVEEG